MTAPWMAHPKLVAWFDDLEDAVTTAFALTDQQRSELRMIKAPRANTWIMLAKSTESRDQLRERLRAVTGTETVPVARDCNVLLDASTFVFDDDTFEQDNGFHYIEVDYLEEGSPEALRRELLSDADDYAASAQTGWFYAVLDEDDSIDSHAVP